MSWWKHFGNGKDLKIFTSEEMGQVSLAIPIMYSSKKIPGSKRYEASFASSGDCDYQGFLVTDFQKAARAINPLIETILETCDADKLELNDIPEDSVSARLLAGVKGDSFGVNQSIVNTCPYIPFPDNREAFFSRLGSNMRRNLKVWERDARKDYRVEFVKHQEIGTLKEAMKIFFELHQRSQTAKGYPGVFSSDTYRSFHMDLANAFEKRCWLTLFFLTFNDEPVSTIYSFEYNEKLYCYLCGFNQDYSSYRPGHLAFKNLMEYGMKKNLKELDFLRGDEEYKTRWNPTIRTNLQFRINKKGILRKITHMQGPPSAISNLNQKVNFISHRLFASGP